MGAGRAKPSPSFPPVWLRMKVLMPNRNPVETFDHVRVGDDVPARIEDDSRAHSLLPHEDGRLARVSPAHRAIPGGEYLHHRGGHLGRELLEGGVELAKRARGAGRLG